MALPGRLPRAGAPPLRANGYAGHRDRQDAAIRTVTAAEDKALGTADVNPGQTATFGAPARLGSNPYIRTLRQATDDSPATP